jgi:hypothetical protein
MMQSTQGDGVETTGVGTRKGWARDVSFQLPFSTPVPVSRGITGQCRLDISLPISRFALVIGPAKFPDIGTGG